MVHVVFLCLLKDKIVTLLTLEILELFFIVNNKQKQENFKIWLSNYLGIINPQDQMKKIVLGKKEEKLKGYLMKRNNQLDLIVSGKMKKDLVLPSQEH